MTLFRLFLKKQDTSTNSKRLFWISFILILGIGIFARTWEYTKLPPGLNIDEASLGVDSYYVFKYGVDRWGVSYPTQFIAFGQEQNALYGYLLIPFIATLGLKTSVVRLPMLIYGITTLPLIFSVTKRIFNEKLALLAMFFLAISPWHILLSRWGTDINFFPFVFTVAFLSLLKTAQNEKWFVPACFLFGLCFYIYGPSYFIVPVFLFSSVWILSQKKIVSRKFVIIGLGVLFLLAIPIGLFIIINIFHLNSIHVGPVTIPELPSPSRFLSETGGFKNQPIQTLLENLRILAKVLILQTDGLIYNAFEPYGYFYKITFPIAIAGIALVFVQTRTQFSVQKVLLLFWLFTCLIFGILQPININRLNIIFIPLIICTTVAVYWLNDKNKIIFGSVICAFLIGFVAFTVDYHGEQYKNMADYKFHTGLLPAIRFAEKIAPGLVCITDDSRMPYIYVLFQEKPNPASYLSTIQYINYPDPFLHVKSFLRYTFGKDNCPKDPTTTYVFVKGEIPPFYNNRYKLEFFNDYVVYYLTP